MIKVQMVTWLFSAFGPLEPKLTVQTLKLINSYNCQMNSNKKLNILP